MTKLFIAFSFLLFGFSLSANQYLGTDINYQTIDNDKIQIKVVNYRNCTGAAFPSSITLSVYNDSFSVNKLIYRSEISAIASPFCTSTCFPSNTSVGQFGVEAHTYIDTIDLSSGVYNLFRSNNYCQMYFAVNNCCRDVNFNQENVFTDAMVNVCMWNSSNQIIKSGEFVAQPEFKLPGLNTFNYTFAVDNTNIIDSLAYQLVKAQTSVSNFSNLHNLTFNNQGQNPINYICKPPSNVCGFNSSVNPVYGSYFDGRTGNFIATPSPSANSGDVVAKVNLYRNINGSRQLLGYSKREILFEVVYSQSIANNLSPFMPLIKSYNFKAGVKTCINIEFKDSMSSSQSIPDTTLLSILKLPIHGTLSLVDSNALNKTLRFCATPSTLDYENRANLDFIIQVDETKCWVKNHSITTTIPILISKPDSFTYINVRTFEDINRNNVKDLGEAYVKASYYIKKGNQLLMRNSSPSGINRDSFAYGPIYLGALHSEKYTESAIQQVLGQFNTTYNIDLPLPVKYGVRGIAFLDLNANCLLDNNEPRLKGIEIQVVNENRKTFTNDSGEYFFNLSQGNYNLELANVAHENLCFSQKAIVLNNAEILMGIDFPLKAKAQFSDLAISFKVEDHFFNKTAKQSIRIKNNSLKTIQNSNVKLLTSKALQSFQSSQMNFTLNDTLYWAIDSISAGQTYNIDLSHIISSNKFMLGDFIGYKLFLPQDDRIDNNTLELYAKVKDTMQTVKLGLSSLSNKRVYNDQTGISYQIDVKLDKAYGNGFVVLDSLDASLFNLNSLRVLSNSKLLKYNLIDNVLILRRDSATKLDEEFKFSFHLDLLSPIESVFYIKNTCALFTDTNLIKSYHIVIDTTASVLEFKPLNSNIMCKGSNMIVSCIAHHLPSTNNRYKLYLSDEKGDFTNRKLLLDTNVFNPIFDLSFTVPTNGVAGMGYKLSIEGSEPNVKNLKSAFFDSLTLADLPIQILYNVPANNYLCMGDTFDVNVTSGLKHQFYKNFTQFGAFDTISRFKFKVNESFIFSILSEDSNQCKAYSQSYVISAKELPNPMVSINKNSICENEQVELRMTGVLNYEVFKNQVLWKQLTKGDTLISEPLLVNTAFKFVYKDSFACQNEKSLSVVVHPLPIKPVISRLKNTLNSSYTNNNQWFRNGILLPSMKNQSIDPIQNGAYTVSYTDSNGCSSISDSIHFEYVTIDRYAFDRMIRVFPNPSQGIVKVENTSGLRLVLEVYSFESKLIRTIEIDDYEALDLNQLASGLYTFKFSSGHIESIQKISIQR